MPSPIGHTLAGLAIAHAGRTRGWIPRHWAWVVALVAVANLADVDFATGYLAPGRLRYMFTHHGLTHGFAAALVVGLAGALVASYARAGRAAAAGLLIGLVYASHVAMDFSAGEVGLETDMPLFWPLFDTGPSTPVRVFAEFHYNDRANSIAAFVLSMCRWDNLIVIAQEIVVIAGLVALVKIAAGVTDRSPARKG